MKVTDEMISHLSHLARLSFSDEEKIELKRDLENMISFVEQLKEVDTSNIEPLLHITDAVNVLRDDEVHHTITKQEALINAPQTDRNFFIVPKVIKKNTE